MYALTMDGKVPVKTVKQYTFSQAEVDDKKKKWVRAKSMDQYPPQQVLEKVFYYARNSFNIDEYNSIDDS